jgi:hypothetical protein
VTDSSRPAWANKKTCEEKHLGLRAGREVNISFLVCLFVCFSLWWLILFWFGLFETGSRSVAQADLKLLDSGEPPASAS